MLTLSNISYGVNITNMYFTNSRLTLNYTNGNLHYNDFYLKKPKRFILDILNVVKCDVCKKNSISVKNNQYVQSIKYILHNAKGNDAVYRMYHLPVMRVVFAMSSRESNAFINNGKHTLDVDFNKKHTFTNKILETIYKRFDTHEMIVVLTKHKPNFVLKQKAYHVVVFIKNVSISKVALKNRNVSSVSYNLSTINPEYSDGVYKLSIELKHKNSLSNYYVDNKHLYLIFNFSSQRKSPIKKPVNKYTGNKISFDVRNANLQDVLNALAQVSGLNFVTSGVKGTITMRLHNVPWEKVLDLILQQNGLVMQKEGNIILVTTAQNLEHQIRQQVQALKYKEELQREKSAVTKIIKLNYVSANYATNIIDKLLYRSGNKGGFIVADTRNNSIICHDSISNIKKVENIVKVIDRKRKSIDISARIVEITKTYEKQIGIQWGINFANYMGSTNSMFIGAGGATNTINFNNPSSTLSNVQPVSHFTPNNFIVNLPTTLQQAPTSRFSLMIGSIPANYNLDLQLSAGELQGFSKTLSSPNVITLDNEPALIESGQQIPYQQATGTGNTTVAFKQATLKLKVTPRVTNNNQIILNIQVTKDSPDYAHLVNGEPPINTNKVQSTVIVNNGETIVIGGLLQKSSTKNTEGIPGLMEIPLLGWLFKTQYTSKNDTDLYVFVTPRILSNKIPTQ